MSFNMRNVGKGALLGVVKSEPCSGTYKVFLVHRMAICNHPDWLIHINTTSG